MYLHNLPQSTFVTLKHEYPTAFVSSKPPNLRLRALDLAQPKPRGQIQGPCVPNLRPPTPGCTVPTHALPYRYGVQDPVVQTYCTVPVHAGFISGSRFGTPRYHALAPHHARPLFQGPTSILCLTAGPAATSTIGRAAGRCACATLQS